MAVREGDAVAAGQRVATMGNGPQGTAMLYFEIRINGAPGNPSGVVASATVSESVLKHSHRTCER